MLRTRNRVTIVSPGDGSADVHHGADRRVVGPVELKNLKLRQRGERQQGSEAVECARSLAGLRKLVEAFAAGRDADRETAARCS